MAETNASDGPSNSIGLRVPKEGRRTSGPAPPLINGPAYAEIKALYPRLDETTSLEDARRREKERNANLSKPNRRAMRPQRDWPALAFPKLKKTIEPHVPLPSFSVDRTQQPLRPRRPVFKICTLLRRRRYHWCGTWRPTTRAQARPSEGRAGPRPRHPSSKRVERTRAPFLPRWTRPGTRVRRRRSQDGRHESASARTRGAGELTSRCFVEGALFDCANHGVGQPCQRTGRPGRRRTTPRGSSPNRPWICGAYRREQRRNDRRGATTPFCEEGSAVFRDDASLRRGLGLLQKERARSLITTKEAEVDRCMLFKRQRLLLEHGGKRGKKEKYVCCDHEGPCDDPKICPCVARNGFCEKYCACASDCRARYPGCDGLHCGTERNYCFLLGASATRTSVLVGVNAPNALRTNRHARVVLGQSQVHGWGPSH